MPRPSFYVRSAETCDGTVVTGRYSSTEHTVGPWHPGLQHAGPPTALLMRAVQQLGAPKAPTPADALPARLTAEIFRPVPVADLVVRAELHRPGRRVAWASATLAAADAPTEPLMRAQIWLVRRTAEPLDVPSTPVEPAPPPGTEQPTPPGWGGGYLQAVTWELSDGSFAAPGPATTWTRLKVDLVDGERPTGAQHAAVVADAGSGISAVADPSRLVFVNTELSIHLHREPVGHDVWMAARTTLDPAGIGHAHTRLGDDQGGVGSANQTLFVEPR
ncbi:MAG: thioesterase family protein [Jiangellales bacterium]